MATLQYLPATAHGLRQDAWRRCQTPASIKLSELGEDEWEVIRDTEDEQVLQLSSLFIAISVDRSIELVFFGVAEGVMLPLLG